MRVRNSKHQTMLICVSTQQQQAKVCSLHSLQGHVDALLGGKGGKCEARAECLEAACFLVHRSYRVGKLAKKAVLKRSSQHRLSSSRKTQKAEVARSHFKSYQIKYSVSSPCAARYRWLNAHDCSRVCTDSCRLSWIITSNISLC